MQLARNVFPERISREKTLVRKLKEAKVARAIEARYPKNKILELYLNQINLGNGAYGVETASQRYFGKSVRDLNLAEAATLAALPKAPERYNPRRYPERAIQRRNTVIELMRRDGAISDADASLAKAYPLQLAQRDESGRRSRRTSSSGCASSSTSSSARRLYEQGLKVYTTLDLDMQSAAERALESQLRAIEGGQVRRVPAHDATSSYVARARDGDETRRRRTRRTCRARSSRSIRATAPCARWSAAATSTTRKFNRATQALRQPGSTFKPIVYAAAVQNGRPPAYHRRRLADLACRRSTAATWTPQNYDGKFEGPMPMRRALYLSRNLAADPRSAWSSASRA